MSLEKRLQKLEAVAQAKAAVHTDGVCAHIFMPQCEDVTELKQPELKHPEWELCPVCGKPILVLYVPTREELEGPRHAGSSPAS